MESSGFGRLITVLTSPGKTFRSIAERPTWVAPLLVLILAGVGVGLALQPKVDWGQLIEQRVQGQEIPEERRDFVVTFTKVMVVVAPLVAQPVVLVLIALVFWVALKLVGGELAYKTSFSVTAHSFMPSVVGGLLGIGVILGREAIDFEKVEAGKLIASNLAFFAPDDTPRALIPLLASVDVFSIWSIVLFSIGYRTTARISARSATATVLTLWLLWVLIRVGLAAAFGGRAA